VVEFLGDVVAVESHTDTGSKEGIDESGPGDEADFSASCGGFEVGVDPVGEFLAGGGFEEVIEAAGVVGEPLLGRRCKAF